MHYHTSCIHITHIYHVHYTHATHTSIMCIIYTTHIHTSIICITHTPHTRHLSRITHTSHAHTPIMCITHTHHTSHTHHTYKFDHMAYGIWYPEFFSLRSDGESDRMSYILVSAVPLRQRASPESELSHVILYCEHLLNINSPLEGNASLSAMFIYHNLIKLSHINSDIYSNFS